MSGVLETHFLLCLGDLDRHLQGGKGRWAAGYTRDIEEASNFRNHYEADLDS